MNQFITRREPCKLCSGKGTMTLRPAPKWYSWCVQCSGTGWLVVRLPVGT